MLDRPDSGSTLTVPGLRPIIAAWLVIAASVVFAGIVADVETTGWLSSLDIGIAQWLHAHASPTLATSMLWITHAQGLAGIGVVSVLMGAYLARNREWDWLLLLALSVAGGMLLNVLLKHAIHRPRPVFDDPLLTLATWSFPSGHTAAATTFYAVLAAYLIAKTSSSWLRMLAIVSAIVLLALVAFSRMLLGVHYLSDVLAAIAESVAWLAVCFAAVGCLGRAHSSNSMHIER